MTLAQFFRALCALTSVLLFATAARADVTAASGVNIHFTHPRAGEMEMLQAAGFKHIRMDFTWAHTEKEKGRYDFSAYEHLTRQLEAHGMTPYYILDYANPHYESHRSIRTQAGRDAFTAWALAVVGKFQGRGIRWEIWNEPNGSGFWQPRADVREYTALALQVSRALKEKFPAEDLCGPATAHIDMTFLAHCFEAGLLEYWDAVSVHPYRQDGPESAGPEITRLRQLIARHAPAGKTIEVLSGEWGYSSAWFQHDAKSQGRLLARQWLVNAARRLPVSIWYDWHDDGPDPQEAEHNFGTVRHPYRADQKPVYEAKPAYHAARTFNQILAGHHYSKRLSLGHSDHYALLFQKGEESVLALWTTRHQPAAISLPATSAPTRQLSHLGRELPLPALENDTLALTLSDDPIYLTFPAGAQAFQELPAALDIHLSLAPAQHGKILATLENFSDARFEATLQLESRGGLALSATSQKITLPAPGETSTIAFPLSSDPASAYTISARLDHGGHTHASAHPRRYAPPLHAPATPLRLHSEGDADTAAEFHLAAGADTAGLPAGALPAWELDYRFEAG
ncbi:MAG: GH39 family glycosyl hydrolase, partial [Verrucomicrobiales bacterium]